MTATPSVFAQRIASAQTALKDLGLAACLVPSSDPHLSEYLPARWQGREWLSGFTGSMGTLTLTPGRAALFADSRYWTQAETELAGSGIELVRIETGAATHHVQWLASNVATGPVRFREKSYKSHTACAIGAPWVSISSRSPLASTCWANPAR